MIHDRLATRIQDYLSSQNTGVLHSGIAAGDLPPALVLEANAHTRIAIVILDGSVGPRAMTLQLRGYFDDGMREVWLIDPADQTVELWNTPWQPLQLSDDDAISSPLLPGLSLPLPELFA